MKKLLGTIGLILAAYLIHGLYIYWDARTAPPPPRAVRSAAVGVPAPAPTPTSPWAENYQRLRRGEHAALVNSAWISPESDSMSMAAKAILECEMFIDPEIGKRIRSRIEASPPRERDLRLKSLEALRAPCRSLEGRGELLPIGPYIARLFEAGRDSPYNRFIGSMMNDHRESKLVREARVRELMATNDPLIMGYIMGRLTHPDATLDGERIPWIHRGAYLIAWHQVMCVNYGECHDPDSRMFHLGCVNHGSCDYIAPETITRIIFPMFIFGDRSDEYYRRIQAHLDRRRYEAFGLP